MTMPIPFLIFWVIQLLDVITTLIGFQLGLSEGSPFLTRFFPVFGQVGGLLVGKIVMWIPATIYLIKSSRPKYAVINVPVAGVVCWNITLIGLRSFGVA